MERSILSQAKINNRRHPNKNRRHAKNRVEKIIVGVRLFGSS